MGCFYLSVKFQTFLANVVMFFIENVFFKQLTSFVKPCSLCLACVFCCHFLHGVSIYSRMKNGECVYHYVFARLFLTVFILYLIAFWYGIGWDQRDVVLHLGNNFLNKKKFRFHVQETSSYLGNLLDIPIQETKISYIGNCY